MNPPTSPHNAQPPRARAALCIPSPPAAASALCARAYGMSFNFLPATVASVAGGSQARLSVAP
jgi:hypothetical protein